MDEPPHRARVDRPFGTSHTCGPYREIRTLVLDGGGPLLCGAPTDASGGEPASFSRLQSLGVLEGTLALLNNPRTCGSLSRKKHSILDHTISAGRMVHHLSNHKPKSARWPQVSDPRRHAQTSYSCGIDENSHSSSSAAMGNLDDHALLSRHSSVKRQLPVRLASAHG